MVQDLSDQEKNWFKSQSTIFPGEAKRCADCTQFRMTNAAIKEENDHDSPIVQSIGNKFRYVLQFMKRHLSNTYA